MRATDRQSLKSGVDRFGVTRRGRRWWAWGAVGTGVLAACLAFRYVQGPEEAQAQVPSSGRQTRNSTAPRRIPASPRGARAVDASKKESPAQQLDLIAVVNGEPIRRNELARQCLWHYGEEVLEKLVNKHLIVQHCQEKGITVSQDEVQAEIQRQAQRFRLPPDQWLKMLEKERNINPTQYARDIVWPTLALKKLAAARLQVTPEEIRREYESVYGEAVKARLIACTSEEKAKKIHALAMANPDDFGNLAKLHSDDTNSASAKGLIQPIRRHVGDPQLESVAFRLREGEISPILQVGGMYVFLKCEGRYPARQVPLEAVEKQLREAIEERKLSDVAEQLFAELQKRAQVEIIFSDPVKKKQFPGVAAIVNGKRITIRELAEECIARHGMEAVSGMINRRLIEQACRDRNITITQEDIDREIARAAVAFGKVDDQGRPQIQQWLDTVTAAQGIPVDLYIYDAVWPTVALKKLVGDRVDVTEEDLRKGYEANFGERVRCRAIVLDNPRRAQEVWEMARENPTVEYFGELAEQYSIEATSRALKGEVPPIQKHSGNPALEKEAFSLQPGELSAIVQVRDKWVILFCEGRTKPTKVDFAEVRDMIYEDIHEKKLRLAMADEFERLQSEAQIDNYLAGTSQPGKRAQQASATLPASGGKAASRVVAPVPARGRAASARKPTRR